MRRQLNLIFTLAGKDWRLFLADTRAVLLGFAAPIALASALALSFGALNSYLFLGAVLPCVLFGASENGVQLLRERRRSVWLRMRGAPVSIQSVLIARALAAASLAFLQLLAAFAFGTYALGVSPAGSMLGDLLLALGISAFAGAMGLLLAAIGGTEARARSLGLFVILGVSLIWWTGVFESAVHHWNPILIASIAIVLSACLLSVAAERFASVEARIRRGYS